MFKNQAINKFSKLLYFNNICTMYYMYILLFILIEIKIRYVIKEIGKVWSFPKSI